MIRQIFYCAGCSRWKPIIDGVEVEAAYYLPQQNQSAPSVPTWRRIYQPLLMCTQCVRSTEAATNA